MLMNRARGSRSQAWRLNWCSKSEILNRLILIVSPSRDRSGRGSR